MISPNIFYKHQKDWVCPDTKRAPLCYTYYDGQRALSTDGHKLLILKNFPQSDPCFRDLNGNIQTPEKAFPVFEKMVFNESSAYWSKKELWPFADKPGWLLRWRAFFDYARKAGKKPGFRYDSCIRLQKRGPLLLAYTGNESMRQVTVLADNLLAGSLRGSENWTGAFGLNSLFAVFDLLKDIQPAEILYGVSAEKMPVMFFDTPEAYIVLAGFRDSDCDWYDPIAKMVKRTNELLDSEDMFEA